jgi:hypothetical protein
MFNNFITDFTSRFIENQDLIMILVLLFIMFMIYALLSMSKIFKENKAVNILLSVCVAFLSVYFMPKNWLLYFFALPAGTFASILFFSLPFLIILIVAHGSYMSSIGRRFLIGIFILVQSVSWYEQFNTLTPEQNKLRAILLGIAILIFVLDNLIHKAIRAIKN